MGGRIGLAMQDVGFWVGSPGAAVDQAGSKREMSEYSLKLSSGKGARRGFSTEWRCYSKEPRDNTRESSHPMEGRGLKNVILEHLRVPRLQTRACEDTLGTEKVRGSK